MKDMTKGNESKLIFLFAFPMLLGNILQQLYNMVDSIVVGRILGEGALAAVGVSFPIMFLLISLIMGITMGSTILIAQYYGAKDFEKIKKAIGTAYLVLFISSILISVIGIVFSESILKLLNTPPEIIPQAKAYMKIIFGGMVGLFGYNSISAILRGLGDSKTPLYFLIISTSLNVVLDIVFIVVLKFGVEGVAWATVIAQTFSFIIAVIYLNRTHKVVKIKLNNLTFDKEIFMLSLKIGLPTGVQQMLISLGMLVIQSIVNPFGTNTVAAYTAGMRVDSFGRMPLMNFSSAVSSFVGQNLGAGEVERAKKGYKSGIIMSMTISVIIYILVLFFGKQLISLFNTNSEVINIGYSYLKIVNMFYIIASVMFITSGFLRGCGDTMIPMIISVITLWFIRIPIAKTLSSRIGTDGIWWSFPIGWTAGAILLIIYYKTGRWKKKIVIRKGDIDGE